MSNNTSISFKWLDILEKEFDKAFVNTELLLGDLDVEEPEIVHLIRRRLATMCSCFSQLSHKALTIFQINCKLEAEIINLKSEIVEMKIQNQLLEKEAHSLLIQLHSDQLERLNLSDMVQKENIKDKLQRDLTMYSPVRSSFNELEKTMLILENWKKRLQMENELLRSAIAHLQAEVCGARLAARYLDKELAGRMQQLQLLTREDMNLDVKNKLWNQLDAEILLQRHKTVIKVMRQQKNHTTPPDNIAGCVRNVYLNREPTKGLGISVTGGREHGVPILISELEPTLTERNLFVGDAILSVNGVDLNQLTHKEAVQVLSNQFGNVTLTVITLSTVNMSEMEEEANVPSYLCYPFFENMETMLPHNDRMPSTPTAPRTPPPYSVDSVKSSTESAKSTPEKRINRDSPRMEENSETELYGITTLQNIFRNVSSIESSQKDEPASTTTPPTTTNEVAASSPVSSGSDQITSTLHNHDVEDKSTRTDFRNVTVAYNNHSVADVKPIAPLLHSPKNIPSNKVVRSSVISRFGNSNLGTPV